MRGDEVGIKKFSQSEAVGRCRGVKESKLRGMYALTKLADEEVTIHSANLEESRDQLHNQLFEQTAQEGRQVAESDDFNSNRQRKQQVNALVDKLSAMKRLIRFQEESRERAMAFKNGIRGKRNALRTRMSRLDTRQLAERNELIMAQNRLSDTIARISQIELNNIKDATIANKKKKENEVAQQRSSMKQQKETEFLREMQLCKSRQMARTSELEISQAEEMEDLLVAQKVEEFELLNKQGLAETEVAIAIENQRSEIETAQLFEKQKMAREQMQRAQRKQQSLLSKQQKAAVRARERVVVAENPMIQGDSSTDHIKDLTHDDASDSGSMSQTASSRNSMAQNDATAGNDDSADNEDGDEQSKEAVANSVANKLDPTQMTDAQKELNVLAEQGRERLRTMMKHHQAALNELRLQHRNQVNLKQKEHQRKTTDLHKENEEEIENLKQEQVQSMEELVNSQLVVNEDGGEGATNLVLSNLPYHIVVDLHAGRTPEPLLFPAISVFCADIPNVNQLSAKLAPAKFLAAVTAIQERVSRVIKSHGSLFMVETSDIHLWVVASGLMSDRAIEEAVVEKRASTAEHAGHVSIGKASEEGEEEGEEGEGDESSVTVVKSKSSGIAESSVPPKQLALAVVACVLELMNLDFSDIPALAEANESVKLRIGIHSGAAVGGLVGKKVPVYALNGDAVSTAYGLCTQGQAGRVLVSEASNKLFAGEVEVEETAASVKINDKQTSAYSLKGIKGSE